VNFEKLKQAFIDNGCNRLFFKVLSANDNSKNQVYLGPDLKAANVLPFTNIRADRSIPTPKSKRTASPIFKADLDFFWITDEGEAFPTKETRVIYYPQYPEVRLSSLLSGCPKAPSEIIRPRQAGRILLLGVTQTRKVFGYAIGHEAPLAREIHSLKGLRTIGVFNEIPVDHVDSKIRLLTELGRIHHKGWIQGQRISKGRVIPYQATSAAGYTLEAELGITPNGDAKPDFLGWEIKQFNVNNFTDLKGQAITLLTPEPSEGLYKEKGVIEFVNKYGYWDKSGKADRKNFGGVHRLGKLHKTTGLMLVLEGFTIDKGLTDENGGICLVDAKGVLAAKWPFIQLISHWNKKHAQAAYVPSLMKAEQGLRYYRYSSKIRLGQGTDILLLLKAIISGDVYYDPGIKIENISTKPKPKKRSQFRIKADNIPILYNEMSWEEVLT